MGNPPATWGDAFANVPRGSAVDVTVWVPTPPSFGGCGQVNAWANLPQDSNPTNNHRTTTASIAVPYWDLRIAIVNAPSAAGPCGSINWDVRVTNVGNIPSMNVCAFTTLCRYSGPGNYNASFPFRFFTTPNIQPGQSWTFDVNNYSYCNAAYGTQYLKAEINYSAGCFDNCAIGNFAQRSITIR